MTEITKVYKKKKIDLKNLDTTNLLTGEINEFSNDTVYKVIETNQVEYSFDSYVYANTIRIQSIVKEGIKLGDLGLLMAITVKLQPNYNVCMMDDETPHTTKSISMMINYSVDRTKAKLDNLVASGILAYAKIPGKMGDKKVYIVNPIYVRLGKTFSNYLPALFYRSSKEGKVLAEIKSSVDKTIK
jgi:hypothetical protein